MSWAAAGFGAQTMPPVVWPVVVSRFGRTSWLDVVWWVVPSAMMVVMVPWIVPSPVASGIPRAVVPWVIVPWVVIAVISPWIIAECTPIRAIVCTEIWAIV